MEWPASWHNVNIAIKEFISIAIGAALWGTEWKNKDNLAVVMSLLRWLQTRILDVNENGF